MFELVGDVQLGGVEEEEDQVRAHGEPEGGAEGGREDGREGEEEERASMLSRRHLTSARGRQKGGKGATNEMAGRREARREGRRARRRKGGRRVFG